MHKDSVLIRNAIRSKSLVRGQDYKLVGDASKARNRLGWKPTVSFEQLVELLVDAAREP